MADDKRPITGELERNGRAIEGQVIDRELDTALAKYAAVEPRAGLNDRILANLKAERAQAAARAGHQLEVHGRPHALADAAGKMAGSRRAAHPERDGATNPL